MCLKLGFDLVPLLVESCGPALTGGQEASLPIGPRVDQDLVSPGQHLQISWKEQVVKLQL